MYTYAVVSQRVNDSINNEKVKFMRTAIASYDEFKAMTGKEAFRLVTSKGTDEGETLVYTSLKSWQNKTLNIREVEKIYKHMVHDIRYNGHQYKDLKNGRLLVLRTFAAILGFKQKIDSDGYIKYTFSSLREGFPSNIDQILHLNFKQQTSYVKNEPLLVPLAPGDKYHDEDGCNETDITSPNAQNPRELKKNIDKRSVYRDDALPFDDTYSSWTVNSLKQKFPLSVV